MTAIDAVSLVFARNAFYRRMHFLVFATWVLCVIIDIVLVVIIAYLLRNPTAPLYFATDKVSRLIAVTPVNKPNMSTDEVAKWTVAILERSLSINYMNYRSQMQRAERYFTHYGWIKFMDAWRLANNLPSILQNKMVTIAQVVGPPKLITEGILGGAYAWKFEIPVLMTFWSPPYNDTSKIVNPLDVTVIVQRQPILQSDNGLGIVQIISNIVASSSTGPATISATPTDGP